MISQDLIDRGGSKLEITRSLLEAEVDIPIPRSTWKYDSQSLDSVKKEFEAMKKPVIVRGSHKNDYHGFINVVPTHKFVDTFSKLEESVKDIEKKVKSNDVKIHCKDWEQPYTPEIHILIQEQSPSTFVGTMMRHPHTRELIIQYTDIDESKYWCKPPVSFAKIDPNRVLTHLSAVKVTDDEIKKVVEMYEKLEDSGIVDNLFSQQMEFGLRPLLFYQARPFKKFKSSKKFDFPLLHDKSKHPYISSSECFGITAEEGIEIPFIIADCRRDEWELIKNSKDKPYGLIQLDKDLEYLPIKNKIGKLVIFCSPCEPINYLFHGNYRLMKKADFSLIHFYVNNVKHMCPYRRNELSVFRESVLFSNGEYAVIIPKKLIKPQSF